MAQKITTTLVDDLDGSTIEPGTGRSVRFGFDGTEYEIDLSDANYSAFRDAINDYIGAARRLGKNSGKPTRASRATSGEDLAKIREWATTNGYEVSQRGRIAQNVKDAYYSSTK